MAESDNDIEYLDEDADIVQQCVLAAPAPQYVPPVEEKLPLLVERQPAERPERRRKRKKQEDDSDYDPKQDTVPASPPRPKKRKQPVSHKRTKPYQKEARHPSTFYSKKRRFTIGNEGMPDRKTLNIRIPDYDDPLCLPVKAIKQEASDIKRLNNWNNVCLEHFKHCDNLLKPERGETHSSSRTMVFRNIINKQSGQHETTIWSKTCVENEDGDRKSEIFQCVLPRYKEKKVLSNFSLNLGRKAKPYHVSDEVILCKEDHKDGEVLVVYKPQNSLSAAYKLVTAEDKKDSKDDIEDKDDEEAKMYMKELLCCKMCAPCFQTSWRGVKRTDKKPISCPICSRSSFVTIYNLLTHFKTHSSEEMQKYKFVISNILAEMVEYHYKCRICREKFNSIKELRQHVTTHQGHELFKCEVGNHITK